MSDILRLGIVRAYGRASGLAFTKWAALIPMALYCVVALLTCRSIIFGEGVPALRHDWSWPTSDYHFAHWLRSYLTTWTSNSLGAPSVYPTLWADILALQMIGTILGREMTLKCFLLAMEMAAAYGVYAASRAVGARPLPAFVAGTVYVTCPVLFNKIIAGHYLYWIAFAMLPYFIFLAVAMDGRGVSARRRVGLTVLGGLLLLFASGQIQMLLFVPAILFSFVAIAKHRRRLAAHAAGVTLIGAAAQCYSLLSLYKEQANPALGSARATLQWASDLSVKPEDAIRLSGYITRYFADALHAGTSEHIRLALLVIPLTIAVVGVRFASTDRFVAYFEALAMSGLIVSMGLNPPFGTVMKWLFENYAAFTVLREFYHVMMVPALALSILFALVTTKCGRDAALGDGLAVVLGAAYAFAVFPVYQGSFNGFLHSYRFDRQFVEASKSVTASTDGSRILWTPAEQPMSTSKTLSAGSDPFFYDVGGHNSLYEYTPTPPQSLAIAGLRYDVPGSSAFLGALGTRFVLDRQEWLSRLPDFVSSAHVDKRRWQEHALSRVIDSRRDAYAHVRTVGDIGVFENRSYRPIVRAAPLPTVVPDGLGRLMRAPHSPSVEAANFIVPYVDASLPLPASDTLGESTNVDDASLTPMFLNHHNVVRVMPSLASYDPDESWVSNWPLFYISPYYAATAVDGAATFSDATLQIHLAVPAAQHDAAIAIQTIVSDTTLPLWLRVGNGAWTRLNVTSPELHWQIVGSGPLVAGDNLIEIRGSRGFKAVLSAAAATRSQWEAARRAQRAFFMSTARASSTVPNVRFERTTATSIRGRIEAARGPFSLLFADRFSPRWQLFVGGRLVDRHYVANGFLNGYIVKATGTSDFELRYDDRRANVLLFVQWCTLVLSMLVLVYCACGDRLRKMFAQLHV